MKTTYRFPPAPRAVRLRRDAWLRLGLLRTIFPIFGAIFLVIGWAFASEPIVRNFGSDATGVVQEIGRDHKDNSGHEYFVSFKYVNRDQVHDVGLGKVNDLQSPLPRIGDTIPIRVLQVGSHYDAAVKESTFATGGIACCGLFLAGLCGANSLLFYFAWIAPLRERRLLRNGRIVSGEIIGLDESKGRIRYTFSSEDPRDCWVSSSAMKRLQTARTAVVFKWPTRHARSLLYEGSMYEIAGAEVVTEDEGN